MRNFRRLIIMGLVVAGAAGCATRHDSPRLFVGKPLSHVEATMPKYGGIDGTDKKGRAFKRWNFDDVEKVSVQYSHVIQNPGMAAVSGGLSFGNEMRQQYCSVVAYYDPATRVVTDFKVNRQGGGQCRRMETYLDGSAFLPTDFPG